jgi:hypothetical protein
VSNSSLAAVLWHLHQELLHKVDMSIEVSAAELRRMNCFLWPLHFLQKKCNPTVQSFWLEYKLSYSDSCLSSSPSDPRLFVSISVVH